MHELMSRDMLPDSPNLLMCFVPEPVGLEQRPLKYEMAFAVRSRRRPTEWSLPGAQRSDGGMSKAGCGGDCLRLKIKIRCVDKK